MEKLRILNPDTQSIIEAVEIRNLQPELYSLISFSLSLYNSALDNFKAGKYESAWQHISDSVSLFPYAEIPLQFAFVLSLELGEYQHAKRILDYLEPFHDGNEHKRLVAQLEYELSIYNELISGSQNKVDGGNQRLVHKVLLSLGENGSTIADPIQGGKGGRSLPQHKPRQVIYKYLTFVSIPFVVITVVLLLRSNSTINHKNRTVFYQEMQIATLDSTVEVKAIDLRSQSVIIQFYKAYHLRDYIKCAQILKNNTSVIDTIVAVDSLIVENICSKLYEAENFQFVLDIPFESSFHIHSHFQLILSSAGETRRNQKIAFVQQYPHSHIYTSPLLRELYDTEVNDDLRMQYASKLYELVNDSRILDLRFLLTNKMISELEQLRGLSASKQ